MSTFSPVCNAASIDGASEWTKRPREGGGEASTEINKTGVSYYKTSTGCILGFLLLLFKSAKNIFQSADWVGVD